MEFINEFNSENQRSYRKARRNLEFNAPIGSNWTRVLAMFEMPHARWYAVPKKRKEERINGVLELRT
jgi:hypothetical protein